MGLSAAISGGITITALVIILGIIFAISYQINTESLANTEVFEIQNALLKTKINITNMNGLPSNNVINFVLVSNGSQKLWNYKDFDLIITYDADIASVKTRMTEHLSYNATAAFEEKTWVAGPQPTQFERPDGIAQGGWQQATGCAVGSAWLCIDEALQDDLDFISSNRLRNNDNEVVNFTLSDVSDPGVDTGHIVRYTYREENQGNSNPDLIVTLYQGLVAIATWTHLGQLPLAFTLATQPLTAIQAGAITDYTDLRLGFNATCNGCPGGGAQRERVSVSWAELQVPGTSGSVTSIDGLQAKEWTINRITNDNLDPGIINNQETAQIVGNLSYPIFSGGLLEISISSSNGKVDTDSRTV